ncbi:MAG TPA: CapA family protein [Aggregatilineales bacterium]|nr:CapA family protein [Aggregatilineales bacterium]
MASKASLVTLRVTYPYEGSSFQSGVGIVNSVKISLVVAIASTFLSPRASRASLQKAAGQRVYVVAATFFTVQDSVSWADVLARWFGADDSGAELAMDRTTYDFLRLKLGPMNAIQIIAADQIVQWAWDHPDSWVIVPFDALSPRLKVLQLSGWDVFKGVDGYPLAFSDGDPDYAPSDLTIVAMTGTTAMTRHTAEAIDAHGPAWAAQEIGPVLQDFDYVHVSNEVSFFADCPHSNSVRLLGDFCAKDSYLDVLKDSHVNLVELTGNHNNDYGYDADLRTLKMYHDNNMATFGGGADQSSAQQPLILGNKGNNLLFVGCNSAGPLYAWATDTTPGAARCNPTWFDPILSAQDGNIKFMDVQYDEYDQAWPLPQHRDDFLRLAAAGADVVIGTQAHQPMTFSFLGDRFIHYGLGNFYFDQLPIVQRQFFIDEFIIYRGKLLSIQLLTGEIADRAQPHLMDAAGRRRLLEKMFYLSQQITVPSQSPATTTPFATP